VLDYSLGMRGYQQPAVNSPPKC